MNSQLLKITFISFLFIGILSTANAQLSPKNSIIFANHYSKSFYSGFSPGVFEENPTKGTYSWSIEWHHHFQGANKKRHISLGVALTKIGHSIKSLWENGTPSEVETYGKFPITNTDREFVYYLSFPTTLHFKLTNNWFLSPNLAIEYPIGIGGFYKYKSTDGKIVVKERYSIDVLAFYPALFSLGGGLQVGKRIPINDKHTLLIAGKIAAYSFLAFRAHDDFRLIREEYPFSVGVNVGMLF